MGAIERLRGTLPPREKRPSGNGPRSVRAVRQFVADLPPADLVRSLERLTDLVDDLNRSRLPYSRRFDLLEALRTGVRSVVESVEKQLVNAGLPLPPVRLSLAQRALELQGAVALGFQTVIADACGRSGQIPWWRKRRVRTALHRALYHRGLALAGAYLLYRAPRPGEWASLHDLAHFAFERGIAEQPVDDPLERRRSTPAQAYGEAALFALCNPYRFGRREQLQLRRALPWMIQECRFGLGLREGFRVPEGEDRGPGYAPEEREEGSEPALRLDLSKLAARIEGELAAGADFIEAKGLRGGREPLPAHLARRCLQSWRGESARSRQRLPAMHRLDLVAGFSQLRLALGLEDRSSAGGRSQGAGTRLIVAQAEVCDQSLGGYLLRWTPREPIKVRVGELIGLALPVEDERDREWMLGVIRWMRFAQGEQLECGVELLAHRFCAVSVEGRDAPIPGLLYAPLRQGANAPQLIVASGGEALLGERGEIQLRSERGAPEIGWPPGHRARLVEVLADYLVLEPLAAGDVERGAALVQAAA
jgi:hypothetical protein